jgi:hypothetical protein
MAITHTIAVRLGSQPVPKIANNSAATMPMCSPGDAQNVNGARFQKRFIGVLIRIRFLLIFGLDNQFATR